MLSVVAAAALLAAAVAAADPAAAAGHGATTTSSVQAVAPLPSRIVVADDASEAEVWAAGKLADLLGLPVTVGSEMIIAAGAAQISVGHGAATTLGVPAAALAALDDDSYFVSTAAAHGVPHGSVAIASSVHSARGTMYGTYAFLRALGFEFYAEGATRVPSPLPTALPVLNTIYKPSYESRNLVMASRGIGSNMDRTEFVAGNCLAVVRKRPLSLFSTTFHTQPHHFTNTGSEQTQRKYLFENGRLRRPRLKAGMAGTAKG
jgi:hypothetical protein